jgi:protein MpaA
MEWTRLKLLPLVLMTNLVLGCGSEENLVSSVLPSYVVPETSTTSTTTIVAPTSTQPELRELTIGMSALGRPIVAVHVQDSPYRPVIAIGSIHGDEAMGLKVIERLLNVAEIPGDLNLWVISTVNPDGLALGTRGNANGVDLNRNFATDDWRIVGRGTEKYSGGKAASETETRAVQEFLTEQKPLLVVWWHQYGEYVDDQRTVADYDLIKQFSELTDFPIKYVGCGSTPCIGNATAFINSRIEGASSFVVELPLEVPVRILDQQANAFLVIAEAAILKNLDQP